MSPATPHPAGREHGAAFTLGARLRSSAFNPFWYNWETEARREAGAGPGHTRWAESRGAGRVPAFWAGLTSPLGFPLGMRAPKILGKPLSTPPGWGCFLWAPPHGHRHTHTH